MNEYKSAVVIIKLLCCLSLLGLGFRVVLVEVYSDLVVITVPTVSSRSRSW